MKRLLIAMSMFVLGASNAPQAADDKATDKDNTPPPGFTALFNGKDLTNWQGLIEINKRAKMTPDERKKAQEAADAKILPHWTVKDGILNYDGKDLRDLPIEFRKSLLESLAGARMPGVRFVRAVEGRGFIDFGAVGIELYDFEKFRFRGDRE